MHGELCVRTSLVKKMLKQCVIVLVDSTGLVSETLHPHSTTSCIELLTGAMKIPTTAPGTGPIFLDNLECTSTDNDLLSCRTPFTSVGLASCEHTDDVSVRCLGMSMSV